MKTSNTQDHLTLEQREQAGIVADRIELIASQAMPNGISIQCFDPSYFEAADRPSPDDDPENLLHGLKLRVESQDVIIDFRHEPERVAAAKLREWATAFGRAADELEAAAAIADVA